MEVELYEDIIHKIIEFSDIREIFILYVFILRRPVKDVVRYYATIHNVKHNICKSKDISQTNIISMLSECYDFADIKIPTAYDTLKFISVLKYSVYNYSYIKHPNLVENKICNNYVVSFELKKKIAALKYEKELGRLIYLYYKRDTDNIRGKIHSLLNRLIMVMRIRKL